MEIWVYSDESGVFNKKHNDYYVYSGLVFLSDEERQVCSRKYSAAEKIIRTRASIDKNVEIKAATISNPDKNKLFRSLNQYYKFAVIIKQQSVFDNIFTHKKIKQRYLDYTYKMAVKNIFNQLIKDNVIVPSAVSKISVYVDQHTSATDGIYELHENLEEEFKYGTYNQTWSKFFPPIFVNLNSVQVQQCNSEKKILIRAADIVANRVYHLALENNIAKLNDIPNLYYIIQP